MKKYLTIITFSFTITLPNSLVAQALNYNKNRIACSADGNAQPN